jgi:hypothetical protein
MASPPKSSLRFIGRFKYPSWVLILALLTGCASGDLGRVRPSLVTDDMHSWIGTEAVGSIGQPPSRYGLTDDERELRDLAYPLIAPPFERDRWYGILEEYGGARVFRRDWWHSERTAYGRELMARPYRSATGRYARLIEDIRNDIVRIEPFFSIARRVADMDRKRQQSLGYIADLTEEERVNALGRISENHLVIGWVHHSLMERSAAFRYALERLVIADPSPMAVDAERAWNQLRMEIARNRLVAPPDFGPVASRGRTRLGLSRPVAK